MVTTIASTKIDIMAYAVYQGNKNVEVNRLVRKAPMMFPHAPVVDQRPKKAPRPLFPNQLLKIETQTGYPVD
jgi:hypothetical protein